MTTPDTMNSLIRELRERLADADADCKSAIEKTDESRGYDLGYRDAIREILSRITGETFEDEAPTKSLIERVMFG